MKFFPATILFCVGLTLATTSTVFHPKFQRKGVFGSLTHFTFYATVQCPIMKQWCVQFEYMELDDVSSNDKVGSSTWFCDQRQVQVVETKGQADGDGLFDDFYELFVKVKHNCRYDGKYVSFEHNLPSVSTHLSSVPMYYNITLK